MDSPTTTNCFPLPNDQPKDTETCNATLYIFPFKVFYLTSLSAAEIMECRCMKECRGLMDRY